MGCQQSVGAHAETLPSSAAKTSPHAQTSTSPHNGSVKDLEVAAGPPAQEWNDKAVVNSGEVLTESHPAKPTRCDTNHDGRTVVAEATPSDSATGEPSSAPKHEEEGATTSGFRGVMETIGTPFGMLNSALRRDRSNDTPADSDDAMGWRSSQPAAWRAFTAAQSVATDDTEWSYCLVFPRVAKETDLVTNPRQKLRKTFSEVVIRDWENHNKALWERLDQDSTMKQPMLRAEFADLVYAKVLNLLKSAQCGFHLGIRPSQDEDEIFVLIKVISEDTIDKLATHFRFYKSISHEVYHMNGVDCPRTGKTWGQWLGLNKEPPAEVPAYLPFNYGRKKDFQKMRDDLIAQAEKDVDILVENYNEELAKRTMTARRSRSFVMATLTHHIKLETSGEHPSQDHPVYNSQQEALLGDMKIKFNQLRKMVSPDSRLDKLTTTFMKLSKIIDEQEEAIELDNHGSVTEEAEEEMLEKSLERWSHLTLEQLQNAEFYNDFVDKEKIRLIHRRINDMIDLDQAVSEGILTMHFPLHLPSETKKFNESWSTTNPLAVLRFPGDQHMDEVREYFGEEVAFMFVFINFETRMLLFPSLFSILYLVCQWRNFFVSEDSIFISHARPLPRAELKLHDEENWAWTFFHTRIFEDIFALLMVIWVSYLCASFNQLVNKKSLIWGVDGTTVLGKKLSSFKVNLRGSLTEMFWRWLHWGVVGLFVWETVYFAAKMSAFRSWALEEIEEGNASNSGIALFNVEIDLDTAQLCGQYAITINIKLMTFIWNRITTIFANMENRATDLDVKNAQVYKSFIVSSIVYYYPFVYLAFFKEWVEKGACGTETRRHSNDVCIAELSSNLILNFVINILTLLAELIYTVFAMRWAVYRESKKAKELRGEGKLSDAEEQAKRPPFLSDTDDFLLITISLGFLAMFAVVEPTMAVVALATNLVQIRLLAWRMVNAYRRPVPREQQGIGAWHSIIRYMSFFSAAICVALCVFVLNPVRRSVRSKKLKVIDFIGAEHIMFLVVFIVMQAIPGKSATDISIKEKHEATKDILVRGQAHDNIAEQIKQEGAVLPLGHFAGLEHEPPMPGRVGPSRDQTPKADSSPSSPKARAQPPR